MKKFINPQITTIDLIRHGEPVGGSKYRGQLDDPLSEKGWQQMWEAVAGFDGWDAIVASPLLRCAEFADALSAELGIDAIYENGLKEGGFGAWEGKCAAEICTNDPLRLFHFKRDPIGQFPEGAEPIVAVHARVGMVWQALLDRFAGKHILVIAHAGVIRMMIAHALGLPVENVYRIQVGNAMLTRLQVEKHGEESLATLLFHGGRLRPEP